MHNSVFKNKDVPECMKYHVLNQHSFNIDPILIQCWSNIDPKLIQHWFNVD